MSLQHTSICALLLCTPLLFHAQDAFAIDPLTSSFVSDVTFSNLPFNYSKDGNNAYMGIADCINAVEKDSNVTVRFTSTVDIKSDDESFQDAYFIEQMRGTTTSIICDATSQTGCTKIDNGDILFGGTTTEITVPFKTLANINDVSDCSSGANDLELFIRLRFDPNLVDTANAIEQVEARIILDLIRPEPPGSVSAVATESAIAVTWTDSSDSDVETYGVVYSTATLTGGATPEEIQAADAEARVVDVSDSDSNKAEASVSLTAGSMLSVGLAARDSSGNYSKIVGPESVDVVDTIDFWESYKSAGGTEEGCGASSVRSKTPTSLTWLLLGLGVLIGLRRRTLTSSSVKEESP